MDRKEILDRHSQEVQEDIQRKKKLRPRTTLSKNERPNCNNCKYPLSKVKVDMVDVRILKTVPWRDSKVLLRSNLIL